MYVTFSRSPPSKVVGIITSKKWNSCVREAFDCTIPRRLSRCLRTLVAVYTPCLCSVPSPFPPPTPCLAQTSTPTHAQLPPCVCTFLTTRLPRSQVPLPYQKRKQLINLSPGMEPPAIGLHAKIWHPNYLTSDKFRAQIANKNKKQPEDLSESGKYALRCHRPHTPTPLAAGKKWMFQPALTWSYFKTKLCVNDGNRSMVN